MRFAPLRLPAGRAQCVSSDESPTPPGAASSLVKRFASAPRVSGAAGFECRGASLKPPRPWCQALPPPFCPEARPAGESKPFAGALRGRWRRGVYLRDGREGPGLRRAPFTSGTGAGVLCRRLGHGPRRGRPSGLKTGEGGGAGGAPVASGRRRRRGARARLPRVGRGRGGRPGTLGEDGGARGAARGFSWLGGAVGARSYAREGRARRRALVPGVLSGLVVVEGHKVTEE